MHARIFLIALAAAAAWPCGSSAAEPNGYSMIAPVPGSGGAWDYAVVDRHSGRLFLAQAGVTAVDLNNRRVIRTVNGRELLISAGQTPDAIRFDRIRAVVRREHDPNDDIERAARTRRQRDP